ncbi:hypothetical protein FUAX_28390 [Fulvitalea axinellae]|uniref:Glycosyl hydrolase family 98 putative carbohydrate-binding module domain-containing protein n=1 Tax=Fulvitalea axinellae TaxID=1182444 RepID=A0AAU9CR12_9BACT|nr:hypothetical protein FUAX_28390 [Fulvitalea axinellae]
MGFFRNALWALFLFSCVGVASAQNSSPLSELNLGKAKVVYGQAVKNRSVTHSRMMVAGQSYGNGVGVHSGTEMFVWLEGKGLKFTAQVGVNDKTKLPKNVKSNVMTEGERLYYVEGKYHGQPYKHFKGLTNKQGEIASGSVIFEVYGDNKLLWESGEIRQGDAPKELSVNLKGIKMLKLTVKDLGDGPSGDHANWIGAELSYKGSRPFLVEESYAFAKGASDKFFKKNLAPKLRRLSLEPTNFPDPADRDWLIDPKPWRSGVYRGADKKSLVLTNGLVSRTFRITPNLATAGLRNRMNGEEMLRAVSPEGRLEIDGKTYMVGGLRGEIERGYFKENWVDNMYADPADFYVTDFEVGEIEERFAWKKKRWSLVSQYPAKGKRLVFTLKHHDKALEGVVVKVHYEIYDGLPLFDKWMTVENKGGKNIRINKFSNEVLAMVEASSSVDADMKMYPNIDVESDYAFHSFRPKGANRTTNWERDLKYTSQASYSLKTPCILESRPPIGPNQLVKQGGEFETFRTFELIHDSYDRERKGLSRKRMYRAIAPWAFENPIFMHLTSTDPKVVKTAIDQCVETGYEMVILSFGSGLNMEDEREGNYKKFKELHDYAVSKGIELGSYSLLSSRWISDEVDVINPKTGKRGGVIHGSAPCLGSDWGHDYFRKLRKFYEKTDFDLLEHDGSYPGQICASEKHTHHQGTEDSQWHAWKQITDFYKWLRGRGVYMNIPDYYFLSGTNKTGIGYREVNWSLPRDRQIMLGRQNIYDGQWERTPSMCWTFVPLVQYHGGGKAATLEPLKDHLFEYEAHMAQNYGSGVQACYRGPRLYDSPKTKELVVKMIKWYKEYRDIMNSDIVHVRRPDGRDYDAIMHVNPELKEKGFAMIYNPTDKRLKKKIKLPMYYTGIKGKALVKKEGGKAVEVKLNRNYDMEIEIDMEPNSYTWYVLESGDEKSL